MTYASRVSCDKPKKVVSEQSVGDDVGAVDDDDDQGVSLAERPPNSPGAPPSVTLSRQMLGHVHDTCAFEEDMPALRDSLREVDGEMQPRFIAYYLGGERRRAWVYDPKASPNRPPDMSYTIGQRDSSVEGTPSYTSLVSARLSPWIDCDAGDARLARLSIGELLRELHYAAYLGCLVVQYDVPDLHKCERLVATIRQWLDRSLVKPSIWLVVDVDKTADVWRAWTRVRTALDYHSTVKIMMRVGRDVPEEFTELALLKRWAGERVGGVQFTNEAFVVTTGRGVSLVSEQHRRLYHALSLHLCGGGDMNNRQTFHVLFGPVSDWTASRTDYCACLRAVHENVRPYLEGDFRPPTPISITDNANTLQEPLQPQSDCLTSATYGVFELDRTKYRVYGEAIESALIDLFHRRRSTTADEENVCLLVSVVGAGGHGPLVTEVMRARKRIKELLNIRFNMKLVAIERNEHAIPSLLHMNEHVWHQQVTIIRADMRTLKCPEEMRADLVVSELLGSMGCNELSPECLDGARHLYKTDAIVLPSQYAMWLAPILSVPLHNSVRDFQQLLKFDAAYLHDCPTAERTREVMSERFGTLLGDVFSPTPSATLNSNVRAEDDGSTPLRTPCRPTDMPHVTNIRHAYQPFADETRAAFEFTHPSSEWSTARDWTSNSWTADVPMQVSAVAAYFSSSIYKDHTISTRPSTHTEGMFSWYPALLPLRSIVDVKRGESITFRIRRRVSPKHVWYEWQLTSPVEMPIQNENGETIRMLREASDDAALIMEMTGLKLEKTA